MRIPRTLALGALCLASLGARAQEAACNALGEWTDGADDLQITEAAYSTNRTAGGRGFGPAQPLPPHCHVVGSFERRTGSDGRDYAIRFAINMPDERPFPVPGRRWPQRYAPGTGWRSGGRA